PGADRRARRERHRPAGARLAGRLQRQRGRGTGVDDRDPARLRDQRQGDLDHRLDARLPQQQAVSATMNTRSAPAPALALARALAPALAIALALSGCAATLGDVRPFPAPDAASRGYAAAPAVQPAYAAPGARDGGGSIYASAGGGHRGMHLFQDNKARQVGDL